MADTNDEQFTPPIRWTVEQVEEAERRNEPTPKLARLLSEPTVFDKPV